MDAPARDDSTPPGGVVRIGVDTGGTFTDVCVVAPGSPPRTHKVRSTPDDPSRAIALALAELGLEGGAGAAVVHGTTVALNALLTRRGTDGAALVTNEGFRDLVEIDRQSRPDLYETEPVRPAPMVPRERRFELRQRSAPADGGEPTARGRVREEVRPRDDEIEALCDAVVASGATSVAVCLLHSYADPGPERRVAARLRARGLDATASADLVAEYREAERFSTACVNAALTPVVRAYLARLSGALDRAARLEVLQSSGGGIDAERASAEPVRVLLSGPAGGVVGAARAAQAAGLGAIATLDMGGTSTDVAFHDPEQGLGTLADEVRVAGHAIAVPTLDMHTIGCGGGSLAPRGAGGARRVGPESAGADPGPIAFGRGGDVPTVTDAWVLLGRIPHAAHAEGFLGGALQLDVDAVERAFERLGAELGATAVEAADAVVAAANASMRRALGVMTMERGRDPRATPLVAFGGGGGLAAAELARGLGMPCALVPDATGVLSAAGMCDALRTADRSRTLLARLEGLEAAALGRTLDELADEARAALAPARAEVEASLALRYVGQSYELLVPAATPHGRLAAAFAGAHRSRFGWDLAGHAVELVHVRVRATESGASASRSDRAAGDPSAAGGDPAAAVLGHQRLRSPAGDRDVPVLARGRLGPGDRVDGPALVVDATATVFVPEETSCTVGPGGLVLRHTSASPGTR